jgi:molecular chaperone GrpE
MSEMTDNQKQSVAEDPANTGDGQQTGTEGSVERGRALEAEAERFRDLALRTQADFENFRKRSIREREDAVKFANGSLLERLIPVIDNFELGLGAARAEGAGSPVFKGMEMVARQLSEFLTQSGVEAVEAEGAAFDPNLHEAVGQVESETVPEGCVARQLRKGYRLRERLLRPATVLISKGVPPAQA